MLVRFCGVERLGMVVQIHLKTGSIASLGGNLRWIDCWAGDPRQRRSHCSGTWASRPERRRPTPGVLIGSWEASQSKFIEEAGSSARPTRASRTRRLWCCGSLNKTVTVGLMKCPGWVASCCASALAVTRALRMAGQCPDEKRRCTEASDSPKYFLLQEEQTAQ